MIHNDLMTPNDLMYFFSFCSGDNYWQACEGISLHHSKSSKLPENES